MNGDPPVTPALSTRSEPGGRSVGSESDPVRWVEEHGDFLYACALLRLRDPTKAKDVVQETFLAALRNRDSCMGKAGERGWLVGILKHKICDYYRKVARETLFTDLEFYHDEENESFVLNGLHKNAWTREEAPGDWASASSAVGSLDREEFWKAFHQCASKLPRKISQAFLLRELDGLPTEEICSLLEVSANNLWVMLHRARMALRRCLETNWFDK